MTDQQILSLQERLDRSRVVIGDSILYNEDAEFVLPALQNVDAIVTDPPYGIDAAGRGTIGSGSKRIPSTRFERKSWDKSPISPKLMGKILSRAQWKIVFGGNYYRMPPSSCWLVWDKMNSGSFADCELAWTNLPKAVRRIQFRWSGMIRQNGEARGDHPTQKPVGVMKWCIGQLPDDARIILDPFMGSGTTGVACLEMGRKFIGIERDKGYFDRACERIMRAYNQPAFALPDSASSANSARFLSWFRQIW